jgi:hypothetical protein
VDAGAATDDQDAEAAGGAGDAALIRAAGAGPGTAERPAQDQATAEAAPGPEPAPAEGRAEKPGTPGADEGDDAKAMPMDGEVTIVPGVSRYHRRGCILIRFLSDGDLETMTRREAEAAGSVPCKACQPDKPESSA